MRKRGNEQVELIWPGKDDAEGAHRTLHGARGSLVVQEQINTVNSEAFQNGTWRNKLIWGDNLFVMDALKNNFAGAIDLIYIDPPFATGEDFFLASQERAYRDTWGRGLSEYLSMLWPRLHIMHELLSPIGSIYVHIGWEVSAHVQLLMNEIFGADCLQNVIIYNYGKFHHSKKRWKRDFDVILFYSQHPKQWTFNHDAVLDAYCDRTEIRFDKVDGEGRRYKIVKGRRAYRQGGVTPSSVWRLSHLQMNAAEAVGYPTQKTEELLTRIIAASSKPGDVVADFFCGSGSMLVAAEKLDRRWIGCDLGRPAVRLARQRLLALPPRCSFDILKLEKTSARRGDSRSTREKEERDGNNRRRHCYWRRSDGNKSGLSPR